MDSGERQLLNLQRIYIVGETIEKEIERRTINLWFHRYLYYVLDDSMVSDYEYDVLEAEYRFLLDYNDYSPIGRLPINCVGYQEDSFYHHKILQLANYYSKQKEG